MQKTGFKETEIGLIPEDWNIVEIGSLGKIITGKTPPTKDKDNFGCQYPFITPRDMKNQKYVENTERHLSEKGKNVVKNCLLSKDSVCVSCIGSDMGKVIMNKTDSITNQQINSIIPKIDSNYVYYALVNIYDRLRDMAFHSTAVPILNKSDFSKMKIAIPNNLEEAENIGYILSKLDNKIELNQKMNQTIEKIGQAIFKHWFIDFEFPDEDGKPYKSNGGEMVDSELGEIPKGWKVKSLDEIADFLNGLALQKFPPEGEDYLPVIKIRELRQGITASSDKASPNIESKYIINDGDVLFSWSGSLEVCIWCYGKGALNQHLFKVTSKLYHKWVYFYWVKFYLEQFKRIAKEKATTMGHIQRRHLSEALVVVPPNDILEKMSLMCSILDKQINNSIESQTLSQIRDSLLPKLMSGKIRLNKPINSNHELSKELEA